MALLNTYVSGPTTRRSCYVNDPDKQLNVMDYTHARNKHCLNNKSVSMHRLRDCMFYYGDMSSNMAVALLESCKKGTYLLRNSSNPEYAYSLSIRTTSGVTSVRISCVNGLYELDTLLTSKEESMKLPCVLSLLDHYISLSKRAPRDGKTYVFLELTKKGKIATPIALGEALKCRVSIC